MVENMNYGIPYKGSKNKIAESILAQLPPAKHFYDLFGGGGAMTHCALLSGKYEVVHYNELNPLVFKTFKMALNGEFKGENRWISKENFERLKDTDPYVACCFSFGNDFKTYAYGKNCELFKKAVHYSIVFDDNSLLNNYIDLSNFKYNSENIKERRSELHSLLKKSKLNIEYGKPNQPVSQHQIWLERLQELNIGGGVLLSNLSYDEVPIENDSVIYCDPPYKNTNTYIDDFNHEKFYQWLRGCREKNQQVFISEYQMPSEFFEVYSKEKTCLINANTTTFKLEKLFSTLKYSPIELFEW